LGGGVVNLEEPNARTRETDRASVIASAHDHDLPKTIFDSVDRLTIEECCSPSNPLTKRTSGEMAARPSQRCVEA
jgi:hypothetical protein